MIALSQDRTKRLVAVHGWSGMVLGVLLYAVVLTGTVAVFAHEIGAWSQGGTRAARGLAEPVDGILDRLAGTVDPAYREEVSLWKDAVGHLRIFFHTHVDNAGGLPLEKGVQFTVAPGSGEVLARREGLSDDIVATDRTSALERFLVDLHVQLYVPPPWGLILTGILGLAMMAAAVSGVLVHRHLIRDLFVAERSGDRPVSARDRHVLAATWGVPFAIVLAFTGAFFSFAFSLGLPVVAMVAFGGDQHAMIETVVGLPEAADPTPAPPASLDAMLADSAARAGSPAEFAAIVRYGRADAEVALFHPAPEGALTGAGFTYDGATGAFAGPKPALGTAPSAGGAAVSLMGPLHFGNFAGLLSKAVWAGLGGATCFVILSGMRLWVRRRGDSRFWRGCARALPAVGYGLPIAMLGSAIAYFLALPAGDPGWWTPAGFLIAAGVAVLPALTPLDVRRCAQLWRGTLAAACLLVPALRLLAGGTGWAAALAAGQGAVVSIDLLLLLFGLATLARLALRGARIPAAPAPTVAAE